MKLLWENSNTTSPFDSQTISLEDNNFDCFKIFAYRRINDFIIITSDFFCGKESMLSWINGTNGNFSGSLFGINRYISSIQNSITFSKAVGFSSSGEYNNRTEDCIPYKIYGYYI